MTQMIPTTLNGEFDIILPKHRADREEWHTEAGWEKARLQHMHKTTQPGDVVYYVGAEEGDMCGLLAQWGAELVMFEPNEKVWPNIKAIWKENKLKQPWLFKGFAANQTTPGYQLQLGFEGVDGPIIGDHGFKELIDPDDIPQVKLDDIPMIPNMITMDVEGSEFEVLRGAEQTLLNHHPRIYLSLHPEFLFRIYGEYSMDIRRWIMNHGYKETLLDYQHEAHFYYE